MSRILFVFAFFLLGQTALEAQRFRDPRSYYRNFQSEGRRLQMKNLRYLEAVAKGDDARRINKFREMVVEQVKDSKKALERVGPYQDDDVLIREYMAGLDMYLEAFEKDFGAAEELTAKRYDSFEDLQNYFDAANAAELKMIDAAYKIEKAEDYFAKTYDVDLRRDEEMLAKLAKIDEVSLHIRDMSMAFFRVDSELQKIFKAVENGNGDTMADLLGDLRRGVKEARTMIDEAPEFKGRQYLKDETLYFLDDVDRSIDNELRPIAETLVNRYLSQKDQDKALKKFERYVENHQKNREDFKVARTDVISYYLED